MQCNKAIKTAITPGATYNDYCQAGNLIKFLKRVCTVFFRSDNRGLSFRPYKQVVAVRLMNNYSNNKPHEPYDFKKAVKTKYDAVKEVARRFSNKTTGMMEWLGAVVAPIDRARYYQLTPDKQLTWE